MRLVARVDGAAGVPRAATTAPTCSPPIAAPPTSCASRRRRTATYTGAAATPLCCAAGGRARLRHGARRRARARRASPAQDEDFAAAMAALARLRGPVDAFFDKVTVNAARRGTARATACGCLSRIRATHAIVVADFSRSKAEVDRDDDANGSTASAAARPRAGADMKNLLGGKGANLAEMSISACRCRRASPSPPRSAPHSTPTTKPTRPT